VKIGLSSQNIDRRRSRDERKRGIPMGPTGPMGFPWEWEWESELDGNADGNGNDSTGMRGNGNRTVPVKR
jgi:hypothetical protein